MGHVGKTVTQNLVSGSEITDGTVTGADLASDIAISTTTTNTTNGSFINSSAHNTSSGVVFVKQTGATNNPTMVLEQSGEGGNPNDTQGLHIKTAGQNQGDGKVLRVTTENSNLNSGTAFDPLTVFNGGNVQISGNLVIGTSGKGIDFSATANSGGSMSSELLDDYEEGTFTPTLYYQNTSGLTLNYDNQTGHYTKIGRMVHVYISIQADISGSLVNDNLGFRGLPYSVGVSAGSTGSLVNVVNATGSGENTNYTLQPDGVTLYFSNSQGNGNMADNVGTGTNVLFQVMTWYISS